MKNLLIGLSLLSLAGCSVLDTGDCYYGEVPQKYLKDNQGQFIDKNGIHTKQPVINPEYENYAKCYGVPKTSTALPANSPINQQLNTSYQVAGKRYVLAGERQIKGQGGYIHSTFTTTDDKTLITQEIFTYQGPRPFQQRFLADINTKEGQFTAHNSAGINYILGKNNYGLHVIYIVKDVLENEVLVVQFMSKEPLSNESIPQLVQGLNKI